MFLKKRANLAAAATIALLASTICAFAEEVDKAAAEAAESAAAAQINSGDTAWMLTSTALVLMMTVAGLALFYGGMVRKMNVLATVMQSFAITCLVTVLWVIYGYSLAFTCYGGNCSGDGVAWMNNWIGSTSRPV